MSAVHIQERQVRKTMKLLRKQIYIFAAICLFASTAGVAAAQGPPPFANCRLGVGGLQADVTGYDMGQLNMGLYLDWRARSSPPPGLPASMEYLQIVRVHQVKADYGSGWHGPPRIYSSPPAYWVSPDLTTLATMAAALPGSLWLISNEMDRVDWWEGDHWSGQDETTPEVYATAFHDIQAAIRAADPTARIAIGGIIEATPLRLEYLDRVWDSYDAQYGYSMGEDIDVWNVHGFILREVRDSWGAEVPAGLNDLGGFLYGADSATIVAEHRNISRFQEFMTALRTWMAAHGERNKPLINTEYGILYRSLNGYDFTDQQVSDYLTASFDFLFTAADPSIGFPADENRLVQGWFWYSLNDSYWNGNLFNPTTKALTTVGTTWKNYVSDASNPAASQPTPNLLVMNLTASPNSATLLPGQSITVTLRADVANSGNTKTATGNGIEVSFWDGDPSDSGSHQIGTTQILNDLPGCGRFETIEIDWPVSLAGDYTWHVMVNAVDDETSLSDNIAHSLVSIAQVAARIYLPIILK
jgi:hypothetical protein